MAYKESTAISLTSDFYLRNFYKDNKNAMKKATRSTYTTDEKSYEDSRALRRAAKKLSSFKYDDNDNLENVISSITAFADTYNNAVTSSSDISDRDVAKYVKKLKGLMSEHEDDLANLGITLEEDGTITVDKDFIKEHEMEDFKAVFDPENGFMDSIMKLGKKIHDRMHTSLYEQLTGNGTLLNVTV